MADIEKDLRAQIAALEAENLRLHKASGRGGFSNAMVSEAPKVQTEEAPAAKKSNKGDLKDGT